MVNLHASHKCINLGKMHDFLVLHMNAQSCTESPCIVAESKYVRESTERFINGNEEKYNYNPE